MHFHTVRATATKLSRNLPLILKKVDIYFRVKKSWFFVRKKPAYVANQSDCSIRYCRSGIEHHFVNTENMQPEVLKGCEFESGVHVSQNLNSRPETNRKIGPRKTIKQTYAIEKMMSQEFSDVINSNLWSNHFDNLIISPERTDTEFRVNEYHWRIAKKTLEIGNLHSTIPYWTTGDLIEWLMSKTLGVLEKPTPWRSSTVGISNKWSTRIKTLFIAHFDDQVLNRFLVRRSFCLSFFAPIKIQYFFSSANHDTLSELSYLYT